MSAETIDSLGTEVTRTEPREYRIGRGLIAETERAAAILTGEPADLGLGPLAREAMGLPAPALPGDRDVQIERMEEP